MIGGRGQELNQKYTLLNQHITFNSLSKVEDKFYTRLWDTLVIPNAKAFHIEAWNEQDCY